MKNHEQLKEICDKIGYDFGTKYYFQKNNFSDKYFIYKLDKIYIEVNEIEIVFTEYFMDKFEKYYTNNYEGTNTENYWLGIRNNLDNPVQYLFNLIK